MAVWAMLLGMVTLIDITMAGALMSVAGNIPDGSLLAILSRYLKGKQEPEMVILHPLEAASRLKRLRGKVMKAALASAVVGVGLSIWALAVGRGVVAMLALTLFVATANLALLNALLVSWERRAGRMGEDAAEEALRKSMPGSAGERDRRSGADAAAGGLDAEEAGREG